MENKSYPITSIWDAEEDYVKRVHQQIFQKLISNGVIDAEAWDQVGDTCGYMLGQGIPVGPQRYGQVTRVKRSVQNEGVLAISNIEKCAVNRPPIESCLMHYLAESEKMMLKDRGLLVDKPKTVHNEQD